MKSLIDVKYGSSIKQVQLPARFSSAGFEKCLENVFRFRGKGVFGLRYAGQSDIIVLDEITNESQLIEVSASHTSPLLIVFHNFLSNYQRKEVRLDKDEFNSFLDNIQCSESLTRDDLSSFSRFCFDISDSSLAFPCFEDGLITRDELYNAYIATVERPLSARLHFYFSLIDINESGFINDIGVQLLFQLLYCQEVCCFSTGKLVSYNNPYFVDEAHIMSEQFIVDNQTSSNRFCFSSILSWLMNRGNALFSESFYTNPSAEVLDLSPITPIIEEKKEFSTELIYYLSYLYNSLSQYHEPAESIAGVMSHCIDDNNEILVTDLVDCVNALFDMNEDSSEVIQVYHFCDLVEKAFSEDEEHLDCSQLFIMFGLLSFLHSSNIDDCTSWLIDLLCDNEEKKTVSSVVLYKFAHCVAVLLSPVMVEQIDRDEVNPTLMVMEDINTLVSSLYKQILDFTSPNNIQQQLLREEAVGSSTPNCLFEVIIQYTFVTFCQHWNAERILNYFSVLFQTEYIDTLLLTYPQTHLSHFDSSIPLPIPFDGEEFMERILPLSEHHIELFTQSSLGFAFYHALYTQSITLHFKSLSVTTLLHEFSSYDVYDGSDDNMFFSEYSEFLHALLKKVGQDEPTLPSFFTSLFCSLCHQSSVCINRYELILCLGFLTNELYQSDNRSALWSLLQIGSSIPNTLTSFKLFAEAVVTLTTVFFPRLLPNLQKTTASVIKDIDSSLLSFFCDSSSPKEVMISEDCFYSRAPLSFRLDQYIRLGNGLLNNHVYSILEAFSFESISYKTLLTVLNQIDTPTVSVQRFTDLLNAYFPLHPFSHLKQRREMILSSFFKGFADEDELKTLTVKAAFSSILLENRYDLWNEVLTLFPAGEPLNQSDVMSVLKGMIAMSLFVYMDGLPYQFPMACGAVLSSVSLPTSIEDLSSFFYNHSDLLLPSSYNPSLFSRPVIAYNTVMNLRYIAGLGDILFSHLHSIIQEMPGDEMKKGDFYSVVATIAGQKTIDNSLIVEVYDRIFHLSEYLDTCFYGITKYTLIMLLSGLYPNNRSLISILSSVLSTESMISFNSFHNYLLHVYFLLNEFFECFDLTLVSISHVAMTVATECFASFNLTSSDSLTKQQFEEWMHSKGPYEISRDNSFISHYPPLQTRSYKVTYNSLSSSFPLHHLDHKNTESTKDIQICLDKLDSFAGSMNYRSFTELMKETISQQQDPQGDVARSSFISILSKYIFLEYVDTQNEERELRLENSINLPNEGNEMQAIREGLTKLYDSLDINNGKLIPANQLVSILCLLSNGDIDSRLKSMITESCTVVDDAVYLHEVDLVISAFFLFMDLLLPEVATAYETTPLVQAGLLYNTLLSYCDKNLVEITTVTHFLHQELIYFSSLYKNLINTKSKFEDKQIEAFLESLFLPLSSVDKYKHPFIIDRIGANTECSYYIEDFLREKHFPQGLIGQTLNRMLCRDFLRRMFTFWKNLFPPHLLEPFIALLFTLCGEDDSIQFNDLFIVMTSFITLPQNSVTTVIMLLYDVLQTISETVKFPLVERGVVLLVRWWLMVVHKESLLSSAQIHSLLIEMLFLTEEECEDKSISLNELVGSCVTQSIQPSSLNMQRMMGCLFHSCQHNLRMIWKGEMP